ncbi:Fusaristatin A biosynthesis cluster protein, partial [Dissostichus eleginoides]
LQRTGTSADLQAGSELLLRAERRGNPAGEDREHRGEKQLIFTEDRDLRRSAAGIIRAASAGREERKPRREGHVKLNF